MCVCVCDRWVEGEVKWVPAIFFLSFLPPFFRVSAPVYVRARYFTAGFLSYLLAHPIRPSIASQASRKVQQKRKTTFLTVTYCDMKNLKFHFTSLHYYSHTYIRYHTEEKKRHREIPPIQPLPVLDRIAKGNISYRT